MIKNLNNPYKNLPEILISSKKEIIQNQLFDISSIIDNNIDEILKYFDYKLLNYDRIKTIYFKPTISFLIKNDIIKDIIIKYKIITTKYLKIIRIAIY